MNSKKTQLGVGPTSAGADGPADESKERLKRVELGTSPTLCSNQAPPISRDTLALGTVLQGSYLLQEELGRGGMGAVFMAKDDHNTMVAVKVLLAEARAEDLQKAALQHLHNRRQPFECQGLTGQTTAQLEQPVDVASSPDRQWGIQAPLRRQGTTPFGHFAPDFLMDLALEQPDGSHFETAPFNPLPFPDQRQLG